MRPIPGYEGRYSATERGTVYSHLSGREIKSKSHPSGYLAVCLIGDDGSRNYKLVHRLVCAAFQGKPDDSRADVNHINCDKKDNRPCNIEWCSRSENMRHAVSNGLMESQRSAVAESNKRRADKVIGYDENGEEVESFESIAEARRNGFPKVSEVIAGKRKTTGGLRWKRA